MKSLKIFKYNVITITLIISNINIIFNDLLVNNLEYAFLVLMMNIIIINKLILFSETLNIVYYKYSPNYFMFKRKNNMKYLFYNYIKDFIFL